MLDGNEAGLVTRYKFNEGSGSTAARTAWVIYIRNLNKFPAWVAGSSLYIDLTTDQYAESGNS
jgi:hypothetical protein